MRRLMANTWRNEYRLNENGITYAGHQIGPVLSWLSDDRIARVTCAGGGRHYQEAFGGEYELEDLTVMLGKTEQDRLIEIQLDPHSNRPPVKYHGKYVLQGARGSSSRRPRRTSATRSGSKTVTKRGQASGNSEISPISRTSSSPSGTRSHRRSLTMQAISATSSSPCSTFSTPSSRASPSPSTVIGRSTFLCRGWRVVNP